MTEGVIGRRQKGRRQVWSSKIDVAEGGRGIHRTCKEDISHAEKKKKGRKKARKSRRRFRGIFLLYSRFISFLFQFVTGKSRWDQTISEAGLLGAQPGLTRLAKMMAR